MDIFSLFATDETVETTGVWKEYGDAKFLIARSGNRNYTKMLSKVVAENKNLLDKKSDEAEALSEKLLIQVMAKTLLLDWQGVVRFKGEDLSYSYENAVKLLEVKDFRRQVNQWADDMDAYRVEKLQELEKN